MKNCSRPPIRLRPCSKPCEPCVNATLTLIIGLLSCWLGNSIVADGHSLARCIFFHVSQEKYLHIHERLTSGQDSTDRVRPVRRSKPEAAGRGKNLHRMSDHCEEAHGCETQSHQG